MKRTYYNSYLYDTEYFLVAVPLGDFNVYGFLGSLYNLNDNIVIDEYTFESIRKFVVEDFTETRVNNAPDLSTDEPDQMVLFSYDEDFSRPVGLAISFNGKFYSLNYSQGKRAESELYKIYKNKKPERFQ